MNKKYFCQNFENDELCNALLLASNWVKTIEEEYEDTIGLYFQIDNVISNYDKEFNNWEIVIYYSHI